VLLAKRREFGVRLLPLLLLEVGILEHVMTPSSLTPSDMTEVRSLLPLLSSNQLYQGRS
jgi:hypothetical protein